MFNQSHEWDLGDTIPFKQITELIQIDFLTTVNSTLGEEIYLMKFFVITFICQGFEKSINFVSNNKTINVQPIRKDDWITIFIKLQQDVLMTLFCHLKAIIGYLLDT